MKTAAKPPPAAGTKVNVAVAGLGFMGVTHLRTYLALPGVRLAAVCDPARLPVGGVLPGVAGNVTKTGDLNLGKDVKVFKKFDDLLAEPEIDVVDLCTPTPLHAEQAIAALQAGKHVLCEKPLARSAAECRKILKVAQSSPGFLMPAQCMRFWPGWSWLKQTVEQSAYGKLLTAHFRRFSERPAWSRQSGAADRGGALLDLHIHDTDFAHHLCGPPAAVFSTGVTDAAASIEHVVTQYIYPGGPSVSAEGGWLLATGFEMAFTIHCQRATLEFNFTRSPHAVIVSEPGQASRSIHFDDQDGYAPEIRYFIDCVARRRPPAIVTANDALTTLRICEAEEKSLRTGRVVKL